MLQNWQDKTPKASPKKWSELWSQLIHWSLKYQGVERPNLLDLSCRLRYECGMTFSKLCLALECCIDSRVQSTAGLFPELFFLQFSNTPTVKKLAKLTTRSSRLRCVSAAEHDTAEQYSKTCKIKPLWRTWGVATRWWIKKSRKKLLIKYIVRYYGWARREIVGEG